MYSQSGNPFSGNGRNSPLPRDSSTTRLALDNLLRRELKVSDPNDPKQVAEALLNRYKETPRAVAINREAQGVPFLLAPSTPMQMTQAPTSSDAEMQQAMDDVERDLKELTTNAILKDVTPELEGWGMAIRSAMTEGFNSAHFALDSHQRDKTFGIRRTLGDYARLARLVGALSSPVVNVNYRNLAQSIDEVTSVLLVMMGESLANVSFNRSRYLLQVPYSELQARRDSAIYALRNFIGSTQTAYAPNEWPRGVDAYRQLYAALDAQGQGDLRSLLVENELSRIMDSLIHRASQGNVEGLRHLGATAQLDLQRLRRLVIVGTNLGATVINPDSPPLTAFLEALQLFVDAFDSAGGFRLLRLARPPILFYGLYGASTSEQTPEDILVNLAIHRNLLAELLDCWSRCSCSPNDIQCRIVLDKVLYDLDRAIDLYALGTAENPEPEQRAVAYSYIIDAVFHLSITCLPRVYPSKNNSLKQRISNTLGELRTYLSWPLNSPASLPSPISNEKIKNLVVQELQIQGDMESRWEDTVRTMASECIPISSKNGNGSVFGVIGEVILRAWNEAVGNGITRDKLRINPLKLFGLPDQYEISLKAEAEATATIDADLDSISGSLKSLADSNKAIAEDTLPPTP
jgi:hypothetical protein